MEGLNDNTKGERRLSPENIEKADPGTVGRNSFPDRRNFLRGTSLAAMTAAVGMAIPFHRNIPQGFFPAAFAQDDLLAGKEGLTLLGDRPVNAETPPELLDDPVTPTNRHFVRNNGTVPDDTSAVGWTLKPSDRIWMPYPFRRLTRLAGFSNLQE